MNWVLFVVFIFSMFLFVCWLCLEKFKFNRDCKNYLILRFYERMWVLCFFCFFWDGKKEKFLCCMSDFKVYIVDSYKVEKRILLDSFFFDFFFEVNGFWLVVYFKDYLKLIIFNFWWVDVVVWVWIEMIRWIWVN